MPRVYKHEVLERAAKEGKEGKKGILTKKDNEHVPVRKRGYDRVAEVHKVLSDDMESDFMGFECRELAYELTHRNNIPVTDNWSRNGRVSDNEQRDLKLNVGIHLPHPHSMNSTLTYCTSTPMLPTAVSSWLGVLWVNSANILGVFHGDILDVLFAGEKGLKGQRNLLSEFHIINGFTGNITRTDLLI
uniref:Uncharacterized protein n=1 Tax=Hucho hucho TaxID=62062 RepID=A0A4W5P634_9TELE